MFTKIIPAGTTDRIDLGFPGVSIQMLTSNAAGDSLYTLTSLAAGAVVPAHSHTGADEFVYVLSGDFIENGQTYGPGTSFYGVAGSVHGPHSTAGGCVILSHYSAPLDFIPA